MSETKCTSHTLYHKIQRVTLYACYEFLNAHAIKLQRRVVKMTNPKRTLLPPKVMREENEVPCTTTKPLMALSFTNIMLT